jgi:hypothetical protein
MPVFVVNRKADGETVYRYEAEQPIEWQGMAFDSHVHVEVAAPAPEPVPSGDAPSRRRVSKLAFQELLGDTLYLQIKAAAQTMPAVGLWLDKFNMLSTEADGTSVDLEDPRTRAGLEALIGVPGVAIDQAHVEYVLGGGNG